MYKSYQVNKAISFTNLFVQLLNVEQPHPLTIHDMHNDLYKRYIQDLIEVVQFPMFHLDSQQPKPIYRNFVLV